MTITIKRAEGFVEFCTDLGLRSEWEKAVAHLEGVVSSESNSMLVDTAVSEAAKAVKDVEARMSANILVFHVRALRRGQWDDIAAANPPRDDHQGDAVVGVDTSKFFDDIAAESILDVKKKATGKTVAFDPATEWAPLANEMTNGQYSEFVQKFRELNQAATNVPFSLAASALMSAFDESLTSPTPSGSAASD